MTRTGKWLAVAMASVVWAAGTRADGIRCLVVQNGDPCRRGPVPFALFLNDSLPGTEILATQDFLPLSLLSDKDEKGYSFSLTEVDVPDLSKAMAFREFLALFETFPAAFREEIRQDEWFGCNVGTASPDVLEDVRERALAQGLPREAWGDAFLPENAPPGWGDAFLSFVGTDGAAERRWVRAGDLVDVLSPLRHGERNTQLADFWCRRHAVEETGNGDDETEDGNGAGSPSPRPSLALVPGPSGDGAVFMGFDFDAPVEWQSLGSIHVSYLDHCEWFDSATGWTRRGTASARRWRGETAKGEPWA